jgi:integrase
MRRDNPTDGITGVRPKTKPHHTWTADEIERYRAYWPLGTQQRLVFEFALETASRRCEVVRLGPQHVQDGRIRIERAKGSRAVNIVVTPELQAACDAMPRQHLTYIIGARGNPRSPRGLGNDFARWATMAGLPPRCRLHGLKRASMTQLADPGATTHELIGDIWPQDARRGAALHGRSRPQAARRFRHGETNPRRTGRERHCYKPGGSAATNQALRR